MNTASIVASLSRKAGGLFESVRRLHQTLAEIPGVNVTVLGLKDEFTEADLPAWHPLHVQSFRTHGPAQFGYSPPLKRSLLSMEQDILHTHGIWMYPSVAVLNWHRRRRRPYLISAHGMLDPWAVRNSSWKKRAARVLYEDQHLQNAACLRALCQSEAQSIRALGLRNPICIIPNGIDLSMNEAAEATSKRTTGFWPDLQGRKVLLYLGRIHPKKGLMNLIKAWAAARNARTSKAAEWVLAIAGWDQGGHEAELKQLASELGLANSEDFANADRAQATGGSVFFLGPQFNGDKAACYQNCDAFILPSLSEGLPMVLLEAWAYGKPVLMTPECNLPEGFGADAAIRIEMSVEGISKGLQELFSCSGSRLETLGSNGRTLVVKRFAWQHIANEMKVVYDWVLGGGSPPECVSVR